MSTSDPRSSMVGQDEGTQQMMKEAQQNFPEKSVDDAMQAQADMGPGREAVPGEGGGLMATVKQTAANAVDSLKQANPATRDMSEKHC